jgi:non-specific serine/threonine protein kinase
VLTASRLLEEGQALEIEGGDLTGIGFFLRSLAQIATEQGDYPRAAGLLRERLILSRRLGDRWNLPDAIEGLAWVAGAEGRADRAARLYAAADALREATGTTLLGERHARRARRLGALREILGQAGMDRAWAEGRALSPEQTIALALADDAPDAASSVGPRRATRVSTDAPRLTPREREVAVLLAQGRSNRQIAQALVISERTAAVHVEHILSKLDLHSRWQVAESAAALGLLAPDT